MLARRRFRSVIETQRGYRGAVTTQAMLARTGRARSPGQGDAAHPADAGGAGRASGRAQEEQPVQSDGHEQPGAEGCGHPISVVGQEADGPAGVVQVFLANILEAQQEIMAASTDLKGGNNLMSKAMRQNPNFLEQVMRIAYKELLESGSFESLQQAVASEEDKKQELQQIIVREENSRLRIKELRRQIEDIVKEKEAEVQARTEMIAHLKDVYQETKAKTGMEMKYVSKTCTVNVEQTANKCNLSEGQLREEIEQLKKFTRPGDAEYEAVVIEDRIEKEKERRRKESRKPSSWAARLRRGLGPFARRKKGKKGKGKGKKGGKKEK
uniref:Dynein regulatory complex protein 10 n=1 Tax=Macrostomum lignano TaxID=282301 RepID=A0A1I8FLX0_9PLAT